MPIQLDSGQSTKGNDEAKCLCPNTGSAQCVIRRFCNESRLGQNLFITATVVYYPHTVPLLLVLVDQQPLSMVLPRRLSWLCLGMSTSTVRTVRYLVRSRSFVRWLRLIFRLTLPNQSFSVDVFGAEFEFEIFSLT
jgi:hypothetical protein